MARPLVRVDPVWGTRVLDEKLGELEPGQPDRGDVATLLGGGEPGFGVTELLGV